MDDPTRAVQFHEAALILCRRTGDRLGEGRTLGNLGMAFERLGDLRRSGKLHKQWLRLAREVGDHEGEARALANLGDLANLSGKYRLALKVYEAALPIFRTVGDREGEAKTLFNSSMALLEINDTEGARANAEVALGILQQIDAPEVTLVEQQLEKLHEGDGPPATRSNSSRGGRPQKTMRHVASRHRD